jgi:hypothetical protein
MRYLRSSVCALCLLPLGCQSADQGELFEVDATLASSTCGSGAVDPEDTWSFRVRLEREDNTLTWYDENTGSTLQGTINGDTFTIADVNVYTVTQGTVYVVGCSVRRHDHYSGTVTGSDDAITGLEGDLVLSYSQATGYDCDALIGAPDGFADLPCEVEYVLSAEPAE